MRAARWWPGVLVTLALTAACFAASSTMVTGRHAQGTHPAVGVATALTSSDDATDDIGSPVLEVFALLAVLLVLVRPREASWQVLQVDRGDSSRPFRHGDEPSRAPPGAAIA